MLGKYRLKRITRHVLPRMQREANSWYTIDTMGQCWRTPKRTQPSLDTVFDSMSLNTRETSASPLSIEDFTDAQELDLNKLSSGTRPAGHAQQCHSDRSHVQSPRTQCCLATELLSGQ